MMPVEVKHLSVVEEMGSLGGRCKLPNEGVLCSCRCPLQRGAGGRPGGKGEQDAGNPQKETRLKAGWLMVNEGQNVIFILNILLTSPKFWQLCWSCLFSSADSKVASMISLLHILRSLNIVSV